MSALNESKYLTLDEIAVHMRMLQRRNRDELLLEVLLRTGARPSEVLALRDTSLLPHCELRIIGLKGSNDRDVVLPEGLWRALKALPRGRLFPISYQRLYQIWQRYKPVNKPPKSCRHGMGTHLYDKTKDIRLVQYQLGHKSVTSTEVYSAHVNMRQKLKKGHRGLYD